MPQLDNCSPLLIQWLYDQTFGWKNYAICILVVGGVDIAKNEVANGKHLPNATRFIDKTNGSADMGLKEGVKLSTLIIGAHIGNLGNKRDKVKGVELQETMSACIVSVSNAIDTKVVRTTLEANGTPQLAWNPNNPTWKCNVGLVFYYQCAKI